MDVRRARAPPTGHCEKQSCSPVIDGAPPPPPPPPPEGGVGVGAAAGSAWFDGPFGGGSYKAATACFVVPSRVMLWRRTLHSIVVRFALRRVHCTAKRQMNGHKITRTT
jgi:hypothetical protein